MTKPKKKINVGKELVKRTKNLNRNIESIMGKSAKTESLPIADGLVMYLHSAGDTGRRHIRVDFTDYSTYEDYFMVMDRKTLKGMAEFILNYLDDNNDPNSHTRT